MKKFIFTLFIVCMLAETTGCGTIFRPERKGQKNGDVDLQIALLDGIGLLFFIIPGVIAYAVDFADGTIYLPPGHTSGLDGNIDKTNMVALHVGKENLSEDNIRKIIYERTGKDIGVNKANAEVYRIDYEGNKTPVSPVLSGL